MTFNVVHHCKFILLFYLEEPLAILFSTSSIADNFEIAGGDTEGPWLLPDILVNVRKSNDDTVIGVVHEVLAV